MSRRFLVALLCLLPGIAASSVDMFRDIGFYAEFSDAAYLEENDARRTVESMGFVLTHYQQVPDVEIVYLLASDPDRQRHIIAVRGTANLENAIVDLSLRLVPDQRAGVLLHEGFSLAARAIYTRLGPRLNKQYRISTTGHSLGGAVAVVLAMYLDADGYKLGPVTTFGQPKLTNVGGATRYQHLDLRRVVTPQDLVPLVPPLDVMDLRKLDVFWHLGKEIVLLDGPDYAELEGLNSMMRATRVVRTQPSQENLAQHAMAGYLARVDEKTRSARLVPYETGIDLLNLFGR